MQFLIFPFNITLLVSCLVSYSESGVEERTGVLAAGALEDNAFLGDFGASDLVAVLLAEDSSPFNDAAFFLFISSNSSKSEIFRGILDSF